MTRGELVARARAAAAASPAGSLDRRAAGCAAVVIATTRTMSGARKAIAQSGVLTDEVRKATLAFLDELDGQES
ncbi:hypothetical protein GCM10027294_25500 [Marinactinospora endophytica]